MDLISREAVKEQAKASYHVAESMEQLGNLYEDCINALPSAFEEMTNGEVLKAVFPDCIDYHGIIEVKTHLDMGKTFRRSWWDSPYKGQDGLI